MPKLKLPDDIDVQVEELRYALTNNKYDQKTHLSISKKLLDNVMHKVVNKTNNSFTITNQNLVKYALLSLLDSQIQNRLRHRLLNNHTNLTLAKLLALNNDPNQKTTNQLTLQMQDIQDMATNNNILLETAISALAWLIYDRNGLDHLPLAENGDDVFSKLRQDDLKPIIDAMIQAGIDEVERQRHLDNM